MTHDSERSAGKPLFDLADMVFNGTASTAERTHLEALLKNDANMRQDYLRYAFVHGQLGLTTPALPHFESVGVRVLAGSEQPHTGPTNRQPALQRMLLVGGIALAAAILLAVGHWRAGPDATPRQEANPFAAERIAQRPDTKAVASYYDNRDLPIHTVAMLAPSRRMQTTEQGDSRVMSPTTLKVRQGETQFASASGADVHVEGPALFGVNSQAGGVLFNGSVRARLENSEASFSVLTENLRVVDLGTEFRVTVFDDQHVAVHVLDGEVDVQSRIRTPLFYWSFDQFTNTPSEKQTPAVIGGLPLALGTAARPAAGITGEGALAFDNTSSSFARIVGGTGAKVGDGGLACSSGITLEALFISNWSGEFKDGGSKDYDEFFRKEDGNYRILLSFQNDGDNNHFDVPDVTPGPCLSFGLYLEEFGYSELDMPLDGRNGRPTVSELTDGAPHHVVATYDSFTGRKAIFLDGRLCFEHVFPIGTLLLSGGPVPAEIGNTRELEPFDGVIDEFAFYDFALTPAEIAAHYQNASSGKTYFGDAAEQLQSVRWQSVTHITEGQTRFFNQLTGRPLEELPLERPAARRN